MPVINLAYEDRFRYTIYNGNFGSLVIPEPDGWRTDEKEYARHKDLDGIFPKFSNNLKFKGDSAVQITLVRTLDGINAKIRLTKDEQHPHTNEWVRSYDGFLDMTTYTITAGVVSMKFNSGGLEQLRKSRWSKKVELERLQTIDGDLLTELKTETIPLDGRRIFLSTSFETSEINNEAKTEVETNAGNTRGITTAIPLIIKTNQHQNIAQSPAYQTTGLELTGDSGMMFILNADRDRIFDISINLNFDAFFEKYENVQWCFYQVCLTTYENGNSFDLKNRTVLYELNSGFANSDPRKLPADYDAAYPAFTKNIQISYRDSSFEIKAGESLAFEAFLKSDMYVDNQAGVRCFAKNLTVTEGVFPLKVEEDSFFEKSTTKTIMIYEQGERLSEIMTGRSDAFYSEELGRTDIGYAIDGDSSLISCSHGQWIRGFDKSPASEDNKYKPFATSFKDYIESLSATRNLSLGIEKFGLSERFRVEKKKFFYNNNVLIRLADLVDGEWIYTQVSKFKRSEAPEYYDAGLLLGYEKGWDNEEAMGLDEPNAKSEYTTPITAVDTIYTKISKYLAGSYPIEFLRRKSKELFPTEDHSNDKEIFLFTLKRSGSGKYEERKWQDDLEKEPTGIFSPETATNLTLSPFNILLRHGWVIAAGLTKNITDYIRFGSSEGNSKLKTKLTGGNEYAENGDIIISELERPRYLPEFLEFEFPVGFDIIKQVEGSTEIQGKKIQNFYGLVEFKNDNNDLERGFLINLKPNGNGKWKLLKANR